jgi:hypothetical protein
MVSRPTILPVSSLEEECSRNPTFSDDDRFNFLRNFPVIYDSRIYSEYRLYEKRYFTIYHCLPIIILYGIAIFLTTLAAVQPYSILSLVLTILFGVKFLFLLLLNSPQLLSKFPNRCFCVVTSIQRSLIGRHIEGKYPFH